MDNRIHSRWTDRLYVSGVRYRGVAILCGHTRLPVSIAPPVHKVKAMNENDRYTDPPKPLPDWVVALWITFEILLVIGGVVGAIWLTPWMGLLTLAGFAMIMALG